MEMYQIKNKDNIKLHNNLYAVTSERDYEMERLILLVDLEDIKYGEYVLVEGGHCSCYDFDETQWDALKLTKEELENLLSNADKYGGLRYKLKRFLTYYGGFNFDKKENNNEGNNF